MSKRRNPLFRPTALAALALALFVVGPRRVRAQDDSPLPHQRADAAAEAYERGQRLFEKGLYEKAIAEFDRAVKSKPDFHLAHYAAGNALARLSRLREAQQRYEEAVAIRPKFKNGWNALGVSHLSRRDFVAALRALDKALALDAGFHLARFHRGKALLGLERYEQAETAFRKVLVTRPDDHDTRVALASALASQRKTDEALVELDRVQAKAPEHTGAYLVRAGVLVARGSLDAASEAVAKALQVGGDVPHVRIEIGRSAAQVANHAAKRREYAAQVRALEVLVAVQPKDVKTHNALAGGLLGLYRSKPEGTRDADLRERIIGQLERSLELDPSQNKIAALKKHLLAGGE